MQESFNMQRGAAEADDKIEVSLRTFAQNCVTVVFGLLPLFFIPVAFAPFGYTKTLLVIAGVLAAVIFFSLSILRSGKISIQTPWALIALWAVAILSVVSALLSGDTLDSFVGNSLEVHTALFTVLLAGVASIAGFLGQTKATIMRMYILLTASAVVLGIFHILRMAFGADFLSLGVFTGSTSTPLGGWNDLGLFFGLTILLSLVALEQLPLTKPGKALFSVVVGFSLIMLMVVNFFAIWLVLGLVSLVVLMYTLTKDRFSDGTMQMGGESAAISLQSVIISTVVFVSSLIFIIGGPVVGGMVSDAVNISYVEVRPSFEATADIARNVYQDNAFVGIGPNKFVDAWRMYKDTSINQTIFWATDFSSGSGYVTTQFVTGGIFVIFAWLAFFGLFVTAGFRMLFRTVHADRFWYFIGTSSFVAATYLWGMSFFYNPSTTILLLAAIFTSTTFAAYGALLPIRTRTFSIALNKRAGFALVGIVMVVIIVASSALYYTGRHYASVFAFSGAINNLGGELTLAEVEQDIAEAYANTPNDLYARQLANYQLSKMNALLNLEDPTPEQQQEFQVAAGNGVNAAQLAVDSDPTDSQNWSVLGSIYSVLAAAGVEGAGDRAREAFETARTYDPSNPSYSLLQAQLASRTGDLEAARTAAISAAQLKPNYTDALFFITQLDIAAGNVEDAIVTTRAIISLEPNNPARYYQLGVLESSAGNNDRAIAAFTRAVALDQNYANARYFLALAQLQVGENDQALEQLRAVLALNPGNSQVSELIAQVESGASFEADTEAVTEQIDVIEGVSESDDGQVTTTEVPDTDLIVPVNTVSEDTDAEVSEEVTN